LGFGFGDLYLCLFVVGLVFVVNGINCIGCMFIGDCSGDWIYVVLYWVGYVCVLWLWYVGDG